MRLAGSFAVSALFLAAFARGTPASPGVVDRICQLSQGSSCVSPSQIDLSRSENLILGSCNWREWALCTAIAAGACFVPCEMGGFVDPLCDACVAAMGTAGCLECVKSSPSSSKLFAETMREIHNKRRTALNLLRSQFYLDGQKNGTLKAEKY